MRRTIDKGIFGGVKSLSRNLKTPERSDWVDNRNTYISHDAIVIGGNGECARQCISAASYNVKLENLPEVNELTQLLTDSEPQTDRTRKQPVQPNPSAGKRRAPIRVSKRSEVRTPPGKRSPVRKIIAAAAVLFVGIAAFAGYEIFRMKGIVDSVNYVPGNLSFDTTELLVSQSEIESFVSHTDEVKNILLCGSDIDKYGISRSDSMIILTIDHPHKTIKMTSLMRDMYLKIPGYKENKLNAAFTFGGGNLLLRTIYANFGMKIDRYVCVDYAAFATVVDDLGGVEIEIEEMELEQFNKYVSGGEKNRITQAGKYNFNGKQALSYCRIRKVGTDTARTARQRRVLREIMKKCRSLSPFDAQRILAVVAPCVTTNMTRNEMTDLLLEGLGSLNYDTLGLRIPMDGAWKDKITDTAWYVEIDLNQNARFLNQFIYGDSQTAQALADRQQMSDDQRTENARASFNRKNRK